MSNQEDCECEAGAPAWVVTFGDMMSLLLTFFVMMLSFSEIDQVKFKGIIGSIQEALGVQTQQYAPFSPPGSSLDMTRGTLNSLLEELSSIIPNSFPGASPSMRENGEGVLLTVPGNLLFESGDSNLKPAMNGFLDSLAELIMERPGVQLQVEGHTDNRPIRTVQVKDNWDLSTQRAASVVRYLLAKSIPPPRLGVAGFADSRPVAPNDTPENRQRNRRVEFRFVERDTPKPLSEGSLDE